MIKMTKFFALASGAAALALAACAAPENQMLDQARAAYSMARNDPRIVQHAPAELNQAALTLREAETLYEGDADQERVTHQAYLAQQKVEIAQQAAQLKMNQEAIANAEVQRQQVLLQARSREAEMARQEAARAQQELEQAQAQISEAERSRLAAMTQQEAQMREEEIASLKRQLSEAETRETPRGIILTLKDIVFPVGKAELNPGSERTIAKIADFLQQHPERAVVIEGFTDSTGSDEFNRQLSKERAEAVRNALVQRGIEEERITAQGFGEQYPVASNTTPAGRQLNRRVEIVIANGAAAGSTAGVARGREVQQRAAGTMRTEEMQRGLTGGMDRDQFIGKPVRDRQGREIGEVTDVMIDFDQGRAGMARVSTRDGRSLLVPMGALASEQEGNFVTLNADRSLIETSPPLRQGMTEQQYGRALYEHYGLAYPWEELPREAPVR